MRVIDRIAAVLKATAISAVEHHCSYDAGDSYYFGYHYGATFLDLQDKGALLGENELIPDCDDKCEFGVVLSCSLPFLKALTISPIVNIR